MTNQATWARDTVGWRWSANTLFDSCLSIDHIMDVHEDVAIKFNTDCIYRGPACQFW